MKKVLLLMSALAVVTFSAQAQKTKEEKDAAKARKEIATQAIMDNIVPNKNFQFVPYEIVKVDAGTQTINRYEYTKMRPNMMEVVMTDTPRVMASNFEWVSCEKKKDVWNVVINVAAEGGEKEIFKFAINAKTGIATLSLSSNKAKRLIYRGAVRQH